jgi:hypothetical protein
MSIHFDRNAGKFMFYLQTKINISGFKVSTHDGSSRQGTLARPPRPTLKDQPLSAVHDSFNVLVAILHVLSHPSISKWRIRLVM